MWEIFIGSLILSLVHASIPNHWVPLITIGKTEHWNQSETLMATLITGLAHTLSTVIIGVIVGFIGYQLSHVYTWVSQYIAPVILIAMGIIYMLADFRHAHHHHHHGLAATWVVRIALVATLALVATEFVVGSMSHSLALVSDGWHNLTDVPSLILSWIAIYFERRPPDGRKTFGYQRAGVLVAFVNALLFKSSWLPVSKTIFLIVFSGCRARPLPAGMDGAISPHSTCRRRSPAAARSMSA